MKIDHSAIRRAVLTELASQGMGKFVPVGISARHVHVTQEDLETLFGKGYKLNPIKELSQPGQYAAREQVTVIGPKGRIERVRILGPIRKESQVEISLTDSFVLGVKNCSVRLSGELEGTTGVKLLGPEGQVELKKGLIVAARHLHISEEQGKAFGIHDRQVVSVRVSGPRPCVLENVICRRGAGYELDLHLDTDEANACGLQNGDLAELVMPGTERGSAELPPFCGAEGDTESSGYVSGNIVAEGYAANWISHRGAAAYTGSRNADALGVSGAAGGSGLVGYRSNNASVIEDGVCGGESAGYVSYNGRVLEESAAGNRFGYVSSNPRVLGNDSSADGSAAFFSERAAAQKRAIPDSWREPTPAQKYEFHPVEAARQVIEVPEEAILDLVTESDINDAYRENRAQVYCLQKALITPSARDRAVAAGIKIIRMKGRD